MAYECTDCLEEFETAVEDEDGYEVCPVCGCDNILPIGG